MFIINNNNKSFVKHLQELRLLMLIILALWVVIFIVCFYNVVFINKILLLPLLQLFTKYNLQFNVISTNLTDVFFSNIKLAFYTSLFIVLPLALLIIYLYIIVALRKIEKFVALIVLLFSPILFWLGLFIAYYIGFVVILEFFISYSINNNINIMLKLIEYIGLMLQILLVFGITFQLPVILVVLGIIKIISSKDLIKFLKFAIVIAFIIAAVFTPPDPLSQIIMAIVLIILYLCSYVILKIMKL